MKATTHSAAILVLVLAAGCATPIFDIARAQPTGGGPGAGSPPLTPAPEPGRFVASLDTRGLLTVRDTHTDFNVISPNNHPFSIGTNLRTTVEFHPVDGGADVVLHFTNDTAQPQPLGSIVVPGIRFGRQVEVGDFRHDSKFVPFDSGGTTFFTAGRDYPDDLYSPVGVIRTADYTLGMSLNYPVVEYGHGVRINFHVPGGQYIQSGQNWNGEFQLRGQMQPGESRSYTLSMRIVDSDQNWLHTLVPYRDFFQELYGAARYDRDPRPILGFFLALTSQISATSPYGFHGTRPDLHGWGSWADYVGTASTRGYERTMLWTPSGLYRNNTDNNFPFQFMTGMANTAMSESTADLFKDRVADRGIDLGFWWGRSTQVMRQWDTPDWEPLDPDNPEHVQLAFQELDLAVQRGATLIGLDAFAYMDMVDSCRWLEMMIERHPDVKFVVEPSGCDIHNVMAAIWVEGLHSIQTPPILQDFLIPGHETWANTRMDLYQYFRGVVPTNAIKNAYWQELSDMGYVVVSYEPNVPLTGDWSAKEGWIVNIPPELRSDPRQWQSAGAGGSGIQPDPDPDPGSAGAPSGGSSSGSGASGSSGAGAGGSGAGGSGAGGSGAGGSGAGGSGAGGSGAGGSGAGGGAPPPGGPGKPPETGAPTPPPPPPPPPPPRVTPPRPQAAPPRISTSSISPQAASAALTRHSPSRTSTVSSSSGTQRAASSLADRLHERREARRLARVSDERYQKRMERRQRLIQRLGLGDLNYRDRRNALVSYRAQQRDSRTGTLATHPDGQ